MKQPRSSGILLHPTSLPGRYGIGELNEEAYRFVDFLIAGKQKLWQILPLGPTGFADSPYASFSAFAGNPMLISLDRLVWEDHTLAPEDVQDVPPFPADRVDYGPVIRFKMPLLRKSFDAFEAGAAPHLQQPFEAFCAQNREWLDDYALFMAIKECHDLQMWTLWEEDVRLRRPEALERWRREEATTVRYHQYLQFVFYRHWSDVKRYANEHCIQIVGDIPIFVALDSADAWANPDLFHLDKHGRPTVVAGVPPDYFSETGQLWGNPLYRWEVMAQRGYRWWIRRLQQTLTQVDVLRIDHFRGFEAYWEVPGDATTAVRGRWVKGPGEDFFHTVKREMGELPIIAEDLGVVTPEMVALRDQFGFPGMKVLQFGFDDDASNPFLAHNFERNFVVYTGTHDNDTTLGWFLSRNEKERAFTLNYLGSDGQDISWDMIRLAFASVADVAVVPLQDVLGLGTEARMNYPGTTGGNWEWRFLPGALSPDICARLAEFVRLYGR